MLEMDYSIRIYDGAIKLFKILILLRILIYIIYINTESCLSTLPHDGVFQDLHGRFNPNN